MRLAIVAPVVRTPPHSAGSSKSSFSQSTATRSSRVPSGEPTLLKAFWSSAVVSQSAPSAAGVTPPVTKWKKRGPGEPVAASSPPSSSSSAATAPVPLLGQRPAEAVGRLVDALRQHGTLVETGEEGGGFLVRHPRGRGGLVGPGHGVTRS